MIKENIVFKENGHCQRGDVELLSVSVHQSGKKWLSVNNIYIPPRGEMDLSWIPVETNCIFAGDFNGHSKVWDDIQPHDARGDSLVPGCLITTSPVLMTDHLQG